MGADFFVSIAGPLIKSDFKGRQDHLRRKCVTVSCVVSCIKYPDTLGSSYKSVASCTLPFFLDGSKYFPRAGKKGKARDRYLKGS